MEASTYNNYLIYVAMYICSYVRMYIWCYTAMYTYHNVILSCTAIIMSRLKTEHQRKWSEDC